MKILLAGGYHFFWYEEACARSLESMGMEVIRFSWSRYFSGWIGRIEQRLMLPGWTMFQLERDLLAAARFHRPDVIWIWRGMHVRAQLVRRLKQETGAVLISYNNDDPFGPGYADRTGLLKTNIWKRFIQSIKEYDINFVFRPINVSEYQAQGAKQVEVLQPYFIRELHRPVVLSEQEKTVYNCDLVFVGHYENDGRVEYLRALVAQGYILRLFGNGWPAAIVREIYNADVTVVPALGEDYVKALCGAKLCLSFLSRLNRDTYTRRSFEIPACGKVMVSERTGDLHALFREDEEAAYFSNVEEMLTIVRELLANDNKRLAMELSARQRSVLKAFDVDGRMKHWLETVKCHRDIQPVRAPNGE